MAPKRERSIQERPVETGNKRLRLRASKPPNGELVKHALLSHYYPKVLTLREYLLSRLPASSKVRRKKILAVKWLLRRDQIAQAEHGDLCLAKYLDQILVGVLEESQPTDERWKQWTCFSQRADNSESIVRNGDGDADMSQSEIVDFTIWQRFKNGIKSGTRLQHLLCQGFRKDVSFNAINCDENPVTAIPGIVSTYPNYHVSMLKASPWPEILALMGKEGQRMMIDLILDCGIFVAVESGYRNYFQLSGIPLGDLQVLPESACCLNQKELLNNLQDFSKSKRKQAQSIVETRTPARISFVRNRILYARAALNTQGNVRFGFRHIHVLNRYRYAAQINKQEAAQHKEQEYGRYSEGANDRDHQSTVQIMMYIFPREFGLHNVFTSFVDSRETVQPLKDYTLREEEIASIYGRKSNQNTGGKVRIPRRLRGKALELVRKLRISHSRCSYDKLLNHYCPALCSYPGGSMMTVPQTLEDGSTTFNTQFINLVHDGVSAPATTLHANMDLPSRKKTLMDYATATADVSAFCRSVLSVLIPDHFWGEDDCQTHNKGLFLKVVDRFITLRRFETVSLHDVIQGMKVHGISWLGPSHRGGAKMSQSDWRKRLDLFNEFVYYAFDSLLIPLIRSHFFVTESNVHRYRVFYFRQDVWRSICEPQLASLKYTMLEEMNAGAAQKILDSRTLGFSQLRLLPKETGVRPIMNLRRRPLKKGHKKLLGSSINSILVPVYNMYTYEKSMNPDRLGSTIFSVGDLYNRLKKFAKDLPDSRKSLFFVKVDVQSAFDTIPQSAILRLMQSLPSESEYRISKYAEIKPGDGQRMDTDGQTKSKPIRKWISLATSPSDFRSFDQNLEENIAIGKKHTVFVENIVSQFRDRNELLDMLSQHIQYNMVKIGKKFYRQKRGIPQGSVLSSILCNYFYADLEVRHLGFLNAPGCLLLRHVDDFLLITTNPQHAKGFLQVMHDGLPEYGVTVNPAKTLVNFEVSINGMKIARLVGSRDFPYCGSFINTHNLNVTKDRERKKDMAIADTLTIEYSRTPGKMFQRKTLNAFKIQAHAIFLDTSFNSLSTVFSNIYDAFVETATKMWRYGKCLPTQRQPASRMVIRTIQSLITLAFLLIKSKGRNKKNEGYCCAVSQTQLEYLALMAFHSVLKRKQAKYLAVLTWLDARVQALQERKCKDCNQLMGVVNRRASTTVLVE